MYAKSIKRLGRSVLFQANGWERKLATLMRDRFDNPRSRALNAKISYRPEDDGRISVGIDEASPDYLGVAVALGLWLLQRPELRRKYVRTCPLVGCEKPYIHLPKRGRPPEGCPGTNHGELARRLNSHPSYRKHPKRKKQQEEVARRRRARREND
jgi:hypothetical protein